MSFPVGMADEQEGEEELPAVDSTVAGPVPDRSRYDERDQRDERDRGIGSFYHGGERR
jgi:hypothetical protein